MFFPPLCVFRFRPFFSRFRGQFGCLCAFFGRGRWVPLCGEYLDSSQYLWADGYSSAFDAWALLRSWNSFRYNPWACSRPLRQDPWFVCPRSISKTPAFPCFLKAPLHRYRWERLLFFCHRVCLPRQFWPYFILVFAYALDSNKWRKAFPFAGQFCIWYIFSWLMLVLS